MSEDSARHHDIMYIIIDDIIHNENICFMYDIIYDIIHDMISYMISWFFMIYDLIYDILSCMIS